MDTEDICNEVMHWVNQARKSPETLIPELQEMAKHFKGKEYRPPGCKFVLETSEGAVAVNEAVKFLQKSKPVQPYKTMKELNKCAQGWANKLSEGLKSHGSLGERIDNALGADSFQYRAENIAYGSKDPKDVVLQLIIDDGVPNRGHRVNLFSENYQVIGVGYAKHPEMDYCCVLDFVGEGKVEGTSGVEKNPYVVKEKEKFANADLSSKSTTSKTSKAKAPVQTKKLGPGEIPESEWPEGYLKMSQKTQTSSKSGVKTTTVTYDFTMPDGEVITLKNETVEKF